MLFMQLFYWILVAVVGAILKPSLLRPHGFSWQGLKVEVENLSSFQPNVSIRWNSLQVDRPSLKVQTGTGEIGFLLKLIHFPPIISEIDLVRVQNISVLVPASAPTSTTNQGGSSHPFWLRKAFNLTETGRIDIQVSELRTSSDHGSVSLKYHSGVLDIQAVEFRYGVNARLLGKSQTHTIAGPWNILADVTLNKAHEISPRVRKLEVHNCQIQLLAEQLDLNCPITVSARLPKLKELSSLRFAEQFHTVLVSRLRSRDLFDENIPLQVDAKWVLHPVRPLGHHSEIGQVSGEARASGTVLTSRPVEEWKIETSANLNLEIERFGKLVQFLDSTVYSVPAPFHALQGHVILSAKPRLENGRAVVPLQLQTRLHSQNQKLNLDGTGELGIQGHGVDSRTRGAILNLSLAMTEVVIPLPHLDLAFPPQLMPDSRIRSTQQQTRQRAGQSPESAPFRLDYHVDVKTGGLPMKIKTNLAKSPIPVKLDLKFDSGRKPTGTVHVEEFPLDLFRRNAEVESFQVEFMPKEDKVSGSLRLDYTDYIIYVKLFGTVDKPDYKFISEPPLSDTDVVSVLLFGKTTEDLDPSQNQSVGNVQSAAAGRGLDLASLYLLASTPVESVGYDPQSGSFSAKFRLAEGTSLNVTRGQQDLESVGIRKRIGSHWSITTRRGNPGDPTDKSVSALFQWSQRY